MIPVNFRCLFVVDANPDMVGEDDIAGLDRDWLATEDFSAAIQCIVG